jgi:hypothetical protein
VTGLRVDFHVKRTLTKEPNTLSVKIYNLSAEKRQTIQGKGIPVVLSAGYGDSEATIYSGESRLIDHVRDGANWVTTIQCGDGERAYQWSRFTRSYGPNTPIAQVVRDAVATLSVNPGNLEQALSQPFRGGLNTFAHGYSANTEAFQVVDSLLRSLGFTVSIQAGVLQVLKGGSAVNSRAVLISESTGMIGSPEYSAPKKAGAPPRLRVKSLLQAQITCGSLVEIRSANLSGQFRCEVVEHDGDFEGSNWFTTAEVKPNE